MKLLYILSALAAASSISAIPTTRVLIIDDDQIGLSNVESKAACKTIGKSCNVFNEFCCDGLFCFVWGAGIAGNCAKNKFVSENSFTGIEQTLRGRVVHPKRCVYVLGGSVILMGESGTVVYKLRLGMVKVRCSSRY
ncbi:hypothetical protein P167DRAFT_550221 [Morchella conica CCBAS932]|uniref:Uncharacterized protein n=1 Tax=Morchella conica CCBAS932 TaxID=1392247 RepID=A0A3N4KER6_9PEZI|nr:hypothetical protein P167DRAFT_550221 [Morchella conica CCBAS932]